MKNSENRLIKNRKFLILSVLTAAAVMASGCSASKGAGSTEAQLQTRAIKTEAVTKQTISSPIEQVADVKAGTTLDVVPKVSGTVIEVIKKRGEYVEKGDVLFRIDSQDAESTKRKNELSLKSAQESLKKAKDDKVNNRKSLADAVTKAQTAYQNAVQDYNKMENDYDSGLVTQHQVEQSKQAVDSAQMSLESAQNNLAANDNSDSIASIETQQESASLAVEDSTRSLDNYSVKAAGSGILTDFDVVAGQTISPSKVGQVQQIDPIKITTELSETNYQSVKGKQELVYYNPDAPDQKATAKISYLAPIMSASTKTYTLDLEVPNKDHTIQPGTRYMVQLTTEAEEKVISIQTLSVLREDSDTYVFVLAGDQYEKRKVKLGRLNGEFQEVLEGLKEGEKVVVTGQNTLKDGQKVETSQPASSPTTKDAKSKS
jgi:multidrug efflux pump subunit AcrA (membrane-fusion protein)